jgi:hypothetical protein
MQYTFSEITAVPTLGWNGCQLPSDQIKALEIKYIVFLSVDQLDQGLADYL